MDNWLEQICSLWEKLIEASKKAKERDFDKAARRAWKFLGKSYQELYVDDDPETQPFRLPNPPDFRARLNKSREFIQLYVPYLHPKDQTFQAFRQIEPLPAELQALSPQLNTGEDALACYLMQWRLNYILKECDLFLDSRLALQEALVKGRGVAWMEQVTTAYGDVWYPVFDSVDNLLVDADAKIWREAGYIGRIRDRPAWEISEEFGIPISDLPRSGKTEFSKSVDAYNSSRSGDMVRYIEVWSRMGMGHKSILAGDDLKELSDALDALGNPVWLCICPGVKYPLNLHPSRLAGEDADAQLQERTRWPCEVYADYSDPWPCIKLDFIPNVDNPHATSSLEAAAPLQAYLDHSTCFLMSRIRHTSCDTHVANKAISDDLRNALDNPKDQQVIDYDGPVDEKTIKALINTIQFAPLKQEFITAHEMMNREFEKSTGMDPLMYGGGGGPAARSAREAGYREAHVTSRPEDYAGIVREWLTRIGRKTAICSMLYDTPEVIAKLVREPIQQIPGVTEDGQPGQGYGPLTQAWMQLINNNGQITPEEAAGEFNFSVRSAKPQSAEPGRVTDILINTINTMMPSMEQRAMTIGDSKQYNALVQMLNQLTDGVLPVEELKLPAMAPPPMQEQPPTEEPVDANV